MSVPSSRRPFRLKNWIAYSMFAAIIVVFILWGVHPEQWEVTTGGVAAVVNNETISIAEFRQRADNAEQNIRERLQQFPPEQREMLAKQVRSRALDELIFAELLYQTGRQKGFSVVDAEVRDYILGIPFLNENGRFMRERYEALLSNLRFSSDEFENQVRKQLVGQKLQERLMGSMLPASVEVERISQLQQTKVAIRYAEFTREDLAGRGFVSDAELASFLKTPESGPQIEKYYSENKVQFSTPEQAEARHILVAINDKRSDAEAKKLATEIKAKLNVANFAQLAVQFSDDPGSKAKGGSLGAFARGRMVPAFDEAAFTQVPGKVGDLVKTDYGYHLILVDKRTPESSKTLAEVRNLIAQKLVGRTQTQAYVKNLNSMLKSNQGSMVEAKLTQAGVKFSDTGEFNMASAVIPKLGESRALMGALMGQRSKIGWLPEVVESGDRFYVAQVKSWKQGASESKDGDTIGKSLANRKSSEFMESWAKKIESAAKIAKSQNILQ